MKPLLYSILPRPPHPARDGLAIRNYYLLRGLTGEFRVRAFTLRAPHLEEGEYPEGVEAAEVSQPSRAVRRWGAASESLLSGRAYSELLYRSAPLSRKLDRALATEKPDWVVAHSYHVGPIAVAATRRCWVDFHNLDSQIWARMAETAPSPLARRFARMQAPRVRGLEASLASSAAGVSCVSELDARSLATLAPGARPLVVPNGVDLSRYFFRAEPAASKTIFFVGDLSWAPNADAIRWLRSEIWPLVRREQPDARAEILGREAPPDLLSGSREDFRFLGAGGDTRPHWRGAAVSVAPLRAGGGTRLKILEAAACGVPVVSTSVGVEGLALEAGKEVLVADDARSFASAICDLLSDPVRRAKLARAARARVEALYDWKQIGPGMAEQLLARSVA